MALKRSIAAISASLIIILAIIFTLPSTVFASVSSTDKAYGSSDTVYVAGNPDLFPVEYFNSSTGQYEGLMPDLLRKISDKYGVDFVYINSGNEDQRKTLARNDQVSIISGLFTNEIPEGITPSKTVLTITLDGKEYDVCFGFTKIASQKLISDINQFITNEGKDELTSLAILSAMTAERSSVPVWMFIIIGVAGAAVAVLVILFIVYIRRTRKKSSEGDYIDGLTGAGNRNDYTRNFDIYVTSHTRALYYAFFFCFDIKRVNGYYGDDESEKMLKNAANVLNEHLSDNDFFARVTGGGFILMTQCVSDEKAEEVVTTLLNVINQFSKKFEGDYVPEFQAGVYKLKLDDVNAEPVLYAAQQGYQMAAEKHLPFFVIGEKNLKDIREKEELRKQMVKSVENKEFQIYLQLIKDVQVDRIISAEVLTRWVHPDRGLLMPSTYIGEMEETNAITYLDLYVLEETCKLLQKTDKNEPDMKLDLYCNISRLTFSLDNFAKKVAEITDKYTFDKGRLFLEITESSVVQNNDKAKENIEIIRKLGIQVSLDDVGSGYTSFADLSMYDVSLAKLDRNLLLEASQEKGRKILDGINKFFHSLGVKTLCEGIETESQEELIKSIGIDLMQGFYLTRPLPVSEAFKLLKAENERSEKEHKDKDS